MPTWDATKIVVDMLSAMERRGGALSAYTTAQTAFLNCVQRRTGTRLASFDAALERYAGRTKTAVDACESSGAPRSGDLPALARTTMFATYQRLSKQELAAMRRTSSEYDLLLSTDLGREFLNSVSSPEIVKRYAGYIAQSGSGSGGVSGQASATGFNCIPRTNPSGNQLNLKLEALDCLIFDTPHSWWRTNGVALENRIKNPTTWPRYAFLDTAADRCTGIRPFFGIGPDTTGDGPVPSCVKHDVAYASLQEFKGTSGGNELDETWNPVNKYLADSKFFRDIDTHDCEDPSLATRISYCLLSKRATANLYHFGVAIINKGWPIAIQDMERANYGIDERYNPSFINCATPFIPGVTNLIVSAARNVFTAKWNFHKGCVVGLSNVRFVLEDDSGTLNPLLTVYSAIAPASSCTKERSTYACTYVLPSYLVPAQSISVTVEPTHLRYGPGKYPNPASTRRR